MVNRGNLGAVLSKYPAVRPQVDDTGSSAALGQLCSIERLNSLASFPTRCRGSGDGHLPFKSGRKKASCTCSVAPDPSRSEGSAAGRGPACHTVPLVSNERRNARRLPPAASKVSSALTLCQGAAHGARTSSSSDVNPPESPSQAIRRDESPALASPRLAPGPGRSQAERRDEHDSGEKRNKQTNCIPGCKMTTAAFVNLAPFKLTILHNLRTALKKTHAFVIATILHQMSTGTTLWAVLASSISIVQVSLIKQDSL